MEKWTNGVVAVDVGYGNVKLVAGDGRSPAYESVLPAGAAPASAMPKRIDRTPDLKGGELVILDNGRQAEEWVAGVEMIHVQNGVRQTHASYTTTNEYRALFLGALARLGRGHIPLLVTGLPVSQFYGEDGDTLRKGLVSLMQDRHHINPTTCVQVEKVIVLPQPVGAFLGVVQQSEYAHLVTDETVSTLVVDPGFFSVDWVLMSGRSVKDHVSGSSQLAMSHILDEASRRLSAEHKRPVDRDRLDAACRQNLEKMRIGNLDVDYKAVIADVGNAVAERVMGKIMVSLRTDMAGIDNVVITGGGADLYRPALTAAFPSANVITTGESVLANARGYHFYGIMQMRRRAAA